MSTSARFCQILLFKALSSTILPESCIIPGAGKTGIALEFDCYNRGLNHHEDERSKNPDKSQYFSENIK
jgi:hypothetical protein